MDVGQCFLLFLRIKSVEPIADFTSTGGDTGVKILIRIAIVGTLVCGILCAAPAATNTSLGVLVSGSTASSSPLGANNSNANRNGLAAEQ